MSTNSSLGSISGRSRSFWARARSKSAIRIVLACCLYGAHRSALIDERAAARDERGEIAAIVGGKIHQRRPDAARRLADDLQPGLHQRNSVTALAVTDRGERHIEFGEQPID